MLRTINRPITKAERFVKLYLYCDLSEEAKDTVFKKEDHYDLAEFHMQMVYEELACSAQRFEDKTGFGLKLESMHGPGTEKYVPDYGPYGAKDEYLYWSEGPIDREPITDYCNCYDFDVMEAWNAYIPRINSAAAIARAIEEEDDDYREAHIIELIDAQTEYMDALKEALEAVCKALNDAEEAEEQYTWTREFFEYERFEIDDSEHWFTADGNTEYVRDSQGIMNVYAPGNYIEEVTEEGGSLVILEEYDA